MWEDVRKSNFNFLPPESTTISTPSPPVSSITADSSSDELLNTGITLASHINTHIWQNESLQLRKHLKLKPTELCVILLWSHFICKLQFSLTTTWWQQSLDDVIISAQTPMTVMLLLGSKASQWGREEKSSPTKGSWTPEENMKVRRGQDAEMKTGWKQSMWIWKEGQEKASCSISKCDFGEHFKDDHQVFQCELQKCQRGSVRTYAGPKLLQETVILRRVWRRQHLRPVVTSQLDAHEAKRLCSKRDEIITRACTRFTRSHTVYILSVFTYAGSVRDQERVSGRHTSMCVQSSVSAKAVAQRCCHTHRAELLWLLNWRSQKHKMLTEQLFIGFYLQDFKF